MADSWRGDYASGAVVFLMPLRNFNSSIFLPGKFAGMENPVFLRCCGNSVERLDWSACDRD